MEEMSLWLAEHKRNDDLRDALRRLETEGTCSLNSRKSPVIKRIIGSKCVPIFGEDPSRIRTARWDHNAYEKCVRQRMNKRAGKGSTAG